MAVVLAAFALLTPAAVEQGTITVNQGGAGIKLGITRATVVGKLGKPLYENGNGYMEYSKKNLFDIYLNTATKRVRLIGISGPKFCTGWGLCMFAKGGVAKLKAHYKNGVKLFTEETGDKVYLVRGRLSGRRVFTSFGFASGGRIIQIFIGYCPALPTVCGS